MDSLILFIIITVLNIVTATIKTVTVVKSGPFLAGVTSTINATINAVATLVISRQTSTMTLVLVVLLSNAIVVPVTKYFINKLAKDRLWVYNVTVKGTQEIVTDVLDKLYNVAGIHSVWSVIAENHLYELRIFVKSKNESRLVKEYLRTLDAKYYIVEPK